MGGRQPQAAAAAVLDVAPGWQKIDISALIESIVELTSPHKIKKTERALRRP